MTDTVITKLIAAYDDYVKLLSDSEGILLPLAVAHSLKFPQSMVDRGAELRAKIEKLKPQIPRIFL